MSLAVSTTTETQQRRTRVDGNRVACWRIGSVDLDRCRECLYLIRLEDSGGDEPTAADVVCADAGLDAEVDFAW